MIISCGLATLKELQQYYSYEDALDMLEIITVNNHNRSFEVTRRGNDRL